MRNEVIMDKYIAVYPKSSADFPEVFYQETHELWLKKHKCTEMSK